MEHPGRGTVPPCRLQAIRRVKALRDYVLVRATQFQPVLCSYLFLVSCTSNPEIDRYELQERLDQDPALSKISVLGVDPGAMGTGLLRNSSWFLRNVAMKGVSMVVAQIATKLQPNGMLRTTSKSAADVLRAAFDTDALGEHQRLRISTETRSKSRAMKQGTPRRGHCCGMTV